MSHESLSLLRERPLEIKANTPAINLPISSEFGAITQKIDPSNQGPKLSASQCLHLLTAFGMDATFTDNQFSSGQDLLEVLTDSNKAQEYFSHPVVLSTPYGVWPTSGRHFGLASQAHRDQLLCCFAQLGVTPEFPLVVEGETRKFEDMFRHSIANFHLGQLEIEFTAIAYALYLPPHRAWMNKFGEQYTFDDLVEEILTRPLSKSHCCAMHLVEAMITVERVDRDFEVILSEVSRNRLRERLDLIVQTILQKQAADGSWGPQWYYDLISKDAARSYSPSDTNIEGRLLATGHITQCLAYLSPEQYPLDGSVFRRSVAWLHHATADLDQDYIFNNFCPCSHAAWCLDRFGRDARLAALNSGRDRLPAVEK